MSQSKTRGWYFLTLRYFTIINAMLLRTPRVMCYQWVSHIYHYHSFCFNFSWRHSADITLNSNWRRSWHAEKICHFSMCWRPVSFWCVKKIKEMRYRPKPKGSICLLYKYADTAFWLCRADMCIVDLSVCCSIQEYIYIILDDFFSSILYSI